MGGTSRRMRSTLSTVAAIASARYHLVRTFTGRNLSQFQVDQPPIRWLGRHAGPRPDLSVHGREPENLHEGAHDEPDLQEAQIFYGTDARAVSEAKVKNVL